MPNRASLALAVLELSKQRQRLVEALHGLLIVRLLPLNRPQLQQPLPLQNRERPLFVFFLPLIRLKRGLAPVIGSAGVFRSRLAQEGLGLGDGFGELALRADLQLGGEVFGLLQGGCGLVGLGCDALDLGFFAQELAVFVGHGRDLGFAGFKECVGFAELALLCEEEG